MLKLKSYKKLSAILAVIFLMTMLFSACSIEIDDKNPPTAPLLTILSIENEAVSLAWSESYDNKSVDIYKLYRNDEVLSETNKIQYLDENVTSGEEYEYYVVAYDEAGNQSSKSVRQRVKITDPQATTQPVQEKSEILDIQKLSKSTVKLYTLDDDLNVIAMGSGTIINKEGYILTNYHVIGTERGLSNSDGYLAVAITEDIKKNIQPQYIAQYRSSVPDLDIAVIKIITDLNWNTVSTSELNLVPAKITDSDKVKLGEAINILGYPSVGGETITFTAGHVSGFIDDDNDSEIDWIKTDATVNHGNSGGTAINKKGEMIGIPTAKQIGADNDVMFYLKPVNQAIPVVEDALAQGDAPNIPSPSVPGQEPLQSDLITVCGRIIDAYTQKPVRGAAFLILKQGVTVEDFANNPLDSMIMSYGETDSDGIFACYDLPVGASYSVLAGADGYDLFFIDNGLEISPNWQGDMDIGDVYIERAN